MPIKKRERNPLVNYDTLLRTFKAELGESEKYKKDTIVKLAKKLEQEMEVAVHDINDKIANDLDGYVSRQYIGQCLDKKYKHQEKITAVKKDKKNKKQAIQIATNGTIIDETKDKAEFYRDLDKAFDKSDKEVYSLNDTVVKELDSTKEELKALESKFENLITPEQFESLQNRLTAQDAILDGLRNYVGEYVLYDESLEVESVRPKSGEEKIKISLRKFENKIKESFKLGKASATIEHDGAHVTDWT